MLHHQPPTLKFLATGLDRSADLCLGKLTVVLLTGEVLAWNLACL